MGNEKKVESADCFKFGIMIDRIKQDCPFMKNLSNDETTVKSYD